MSVRWGILGCGNVCEVKSGPALQSARGSELVAVMRRDARLVADFAQRHGVGTHCDTAEQLIWDPNVTAVYIATPPGNHLELALQVAAAGKPAYVEKPMARCYAECRQMLEAFEQAQLPLFVAYYRRGLERFLLVKRLLDAGRLGTIRSVDVRYASAARVGLDRSRLPWRFDARHSGGGLFLDLASHSLDLLDFLFGPLCDVRGQGRNVAKLCDVEDFVELSFTTSAGARGTGKWNFASAKREDLITIAGSAGVLRFSTFGDTDVEHETPSGVEAYAVPNPPHIQQPLIQSVVDSLLGRGTCPSTGASAARTSEVMDRVLSNYYGSREPGFWNEPARWPGLSV